MAFEGEGERGGPFSYEAAMDDTEVQEGQGSGFCGLNAVEKIERRQ
jgi:hypothetical protein